MSPDTRINGAPFAVVDFETTGFAGPDAHVVEVAVVHGTFGSDDVRVAFASRVRPPVPIPESASRVHGITDADVANAPTWADVRDEMDAAIGGRLVIAYNAPADFVFWFVESCRLAGFDQPVPPDWQERAAAFWQRSRWLDLLVVRKATKTRGRPGKLAEVADEYGIALDAHGATGDALVTALLVRPMMRAAWNARALAWSAGARRPSWDDDEDGEEDGEPVQPTTVGALLQWQRGAALYQERDFAAYMKRTGARTPPQSWHHVLEGEAPLMWETPTTATPCPTCKASTRFQVGQSGVLVRVNLDGEPHACP